MARGEVTGRKAAVVGLPVAHSLSPVLHQAAYEGQGLRGWSYERVELGADELAEFVSGLGPEWAGLSVTMPGKHAALDVASEITAAAADVGAANTLVHLGDGGWRADCTDVDGVVGALRAAAEFTSGHTGLVLGAGGTASAVLAGYQRLGIGEVTIAVREPARATDALMTAERLGIRTRVERLASMDWDRVVAEADAVVSTLPAGAVDDHLAALARAQVLLDVVYHPWPTPLAAAVEHAGGRLATGLDMLLHQSFGQFEQFTGHPAPRERMRDALRAATGGILSLPL